MRRASPDAARTIHRIPSPVRKRVRRKEASQRMMWTVYKCTVGC